MLRLRVAFALAGILFIIWAALFYNSDMLTAIKIKGCWVKLTQDKTGEEICFTEVECINADGRGRYRIKRGKLELIETGEIYNVYVNRNFLYIGDFVYERK